MDTYSASANEIKNVLQRQQFIQRAYLNKSKADETNYSFPLFHTAVASTIRPLEKKQPLDEEHKSFESYSTWAESECSVRSSREALLMDKIRKLEKQLGVTEVQIRESQTSKQFLKAKLKVLEEKFEQSKYPLEPNNEAEIFRLNQLTGYAKQTLEKLKTLRELQLKERCIKESYNKIEELMSAHGSPIVSGSLTLTNK